MHTATKPKAGQARAQRVHSPVPPRRRARPRTRRFAWLPVAVVLTVLTTHMTAVAMLNYESARRESLLREIDRVQLEIERLKGQIAVHTDEVVLRRWAEQAGMVRVESQPELTIIGLEMPTPLPAPVAMRPVE